MKKITSIIIACFLLILSMSCASDVKNSFTSEKSGKERINSNLNIIITPDLSNRVVKEYFKKPIEDIALISNIFDTYYPTLYNYKNRVSQQKDAINLAFTNANIITEYKYKGLYSFDIDKKEDENRLYLKTFDGSQTQFQKDSEIFISNLNEIYKKAAIKPAGADIFSFFKNKLNTKIKTNETIKVQDYIIKNEFRNILVLFTDGYVEAGLYGSENCVGNMCYFLDGIIIDKFRTDYKNNGNGLDIKTFFKKNGYGIIPVENNNLKNIEIIVCELYDRSLNRRSGSQTVIPNDLDIIKIFWKDWLKKSGFKKSKLYEKVNTVDEFEANFMSFINNTN